jgi:short-subunit dehydrogenase
MIKKIVVIGATSFIAEHCLRLWLASGAEKIILVARDRAKAYRIASDLKVRNMKASIDVITMPLDDSDKITEACKKIYQKLTPDLILIAHGFLPNQKICEEEISKTEEAFNINAISPILWAEAFAKYLAKKNYGILAVISSVAGDRSRKSNYIYGSAKSFVSTYVKGLQHRFANSKINIILIKPGPTDTPMTANFKKLGIKLAPVDIVAKIIVNGICQRKSVIYAPRIWRWIMFVIRYLPEFIFNRIDI